jgi:ferrous iron transport protein B
MALAGNPNAGKTTLFNQLTGARQHVGNYPGITVDYKEGRFVHTGREISLTDLPGTYSLTAYSVEELVARDYLVNAKPQVVINIVDASNLGRPNDHCAEYDRCSERPRHRGKG